MRDALKSVSGNGSSGRRHPLPPLGNSCSLGLFSPRFLDFSTDSTLLLGQREVVYVRDIRPITRLATFSLGSNSRKRIRPERTLICLATCDGVLEEGSSARVWAKAKAAADSAVHCSSARPRQHEVVSVPALLDKIRREAKHDLQEHC